MLVKPVDAGRLRRAVKNLLPSRIADVAAYAAGSAALAAAAEPAPEPVVAVVPEPDAEPDVEVAAAPAVDDLLPQPGEPDSPDNDGG